MLNYFKSATKIKSFYGKQHRKLENQLLLSFGSFVHNSLNTSRINQLTMSHIRSTWLIDISYWFNDKVQSPTGELLLGLVLSLIVK